MQTGEHQQDWTLQEIRAIPLERICAIFDVDPSLMRPCLFSAIADEQQRFYHDFMEATRRQFEMQLTRNLILGIDAVREPEPERSRFALPSFSEVGDKVEAKWTNRQRPKSTMRPKESKSRRKMAEASRKKNRK